MIFIIFIVIIAAVAVILLWDIGRMYLLFQKTLELEEGFEPFSRIAADAPMNILVLGDSTAVGTGAKSNSESTAGRLSSMYPQACLVNLSENGLKIGGLLYMLSRADFKESENGKKLFGIVLVQIGANDIIRLTSMKNIEAGITDILAQAKTLGDKVVVLHSGNIGESRFFPWYLRPLLKKKSYAVREIYKVAAAKSGARYVDLIDAPGSKLITEHPEIYYASDLLHLTSDGYGIWFSEIKKALGL